MAAIESAVTLLLLIPVEEHLIIHILVAAQLGAHVVTDPRLGSNAGADVQSRLPHRGVMADRIIVHRDRVAVAHQQRTVLGIMVLLDDVIAVELQRPGQQVLIDHIVLDFHDLDLAEVDRKGLKRAELKIQITGAVLRNHKASQLVVALHDLEFLKVSELDRAGHIRTEPVCNPVLVARDRGIVALKLDVPGLAVRTGGGDAIHAVHKLGGAGDPIPLELCAEKRGRAFLLHIGRGRGRAEGKAR